MYLCDLLKIPYSTLMEQPADWVDKMILWHEQKAKAEESRQKEQERKMKRSR